MHRTVHKSNLAAMHRMSNQTAKWINHIRYPIAIVVQTRSMLPKIIISNSKQFMTPATKATIVTCKIRVDKFTTKWSIIINLPNIRLSEKLLGKINRINTHLEYQFLFLFEIIYSFLLVDSQNTKDKFMSVCHEN